MIEEATQTVIVSASPEECFSAASDVARYPDWAADIKSAEIIESDANGHPSLVEFRAAAMGRSTTYSLRYDFSQAPARISWALEEGDVMSRLDGSYLFAPAEAGGTEVVYHLGVELRFPLPGFIKRRAEGRIIHTALEEFQAKVEGIHG